MVRSLRNKIGWFAILGSLILFFPAANASAHFTGLNHMHPDSITKVLCPGDCYSVDIQVDLEKPPEKADVMFVIDTTSSLSDVFFDRRVRFVLDNRQDRVALPELPSDRNPKSIILVSVVLVVRAPTRGQ